MQMFSRFGGQNAGGNMPQGNAFGLMRRMGQDGMRTPMNGGFAGPAGRFGGMRPQPMPQQLPDQLQSPIGPSRSFPPIGGWGNDAEFRTKLGYNMDPNKVNQSQPPIDSPLPTFTRRMRGMF